MPRKSVPPIHTCPVPADGCGLPMHTRFGQTHRTAPITRCMARPRDPRRPANPTAQPTCVSETVACSENMPPGPTTARLTVMISLTTSGGSSTTTVSGDVNGDVSAELDDEAAP
eukprot:6789755-Prymnesium_polylepis.1